MFRLMISNSTANDFIECFPHHQCIAVDERNERIGTSLNVPNQFGVEYEFFLIEPR